MSKLQEKQKAIKLRKSGKSYSQIKEILKVSKGTLSAWLRDYPLPQEKIRELRDWNQKRIENYIETRRKKRESLLKEIYEHEKLNIHPLSDRDVFLGGLFLYWGEGGKTKMHELALSNTNPSMIKFFIFWLERMGISRKQIAIKLHLYNDMDVSKEINFWSKILRVSRSQFTKPYIKNTSQRFITYKRGFGHGTCNILVRNANLTKRIFMGIQVIKDCFDLK